MSKMYKIEIACKSGELQYRYKSLITSNVGEWFSSSEEAESDAILHVDAINCFVSMLADRIGGIVDATLWEYKQWRMMIGK